jgi:hypothetical protein
MQSGGASAHFGWSAVCALFVASFAFVHGMTAHADATLRMVISLGANGNDRPPAASASGGRSGNSRRAPS